MSFSISSSSFNIFLEGAEVLTFKFILHKEDEDIIYMYSNMNQYIFKNMNILSSILK